MSCGIYDAVRYCFDAHVLCPEAAGYDSEAEIARLTDLGRQKSLRCSLALSETTFLYMETEDDLISLIWRIRSFPSLTVHASSQAPSIQLFSRFLSARLAQSPSH